jgi:hypothetical protein
MHESTLYVLFFKDTIYLFMKDKVQENYETLLSLRTGGTILAQVYLFLKFTYN